MRGYKRVRSRKEELQEALKLLRSACGTLQQFYPEMMSADVKKWWAVERNRMQRERVEKGEVGDEIHSLLEEGEYEDIETGSQEECAVGARDGSKTTFADAD